MTKLRRLTAGVVASLQHRLTRAAVAAKQLSEQLDPPHAKPAVELDPSVLANAALQAFILSIPQVRQRDVFTAVFVFKPVPAGGEMMGFATTGTEATLKHRMRAWVAPQPKTTNTGEAIH